MNAGHPAWCRLGEDETSPHESKNYLVRDRDGVLVDVYLVDYGLGPLVTLDVTAEVETMLIEFTLGETTKLHNHLGKLLTMTYP